MAHWTRVRDDSTGHQIDVLTETLPRKGLTPIEGYPTHEGRSPRRPKYLTDLGGEPTTPRPSGDTEDPANNPSADASATPEEN